MALYITALQINKSKGKINFLSGIRGEVCYLFISVCLSSYELFNIMHRRAFSQNAKLSSRVRFQCTHYDFFRLDLTVGQQRQYITVISEHELTPDLLPIHGNKSRTDTEKLLQLQTTFNKSG